MATEEHEFERVELNGNGGPPPPFMKQSVSVYELPEYFSDNKYFQRSDPGTNKRRLGNLSDTDDLAGAVRKLATEPGAYLAEYRVDGRVMDSQVIVVKAQAQVVELNPTPTQTRVQPTQPAQSNPANDRLSHLERAVLALTETLKQSSNEPPKKPVDEFRETLEMMREFQAMTKEAVREVVAQTSPPSQPTNNANSDKDEDERALMLLLKNDTLRRKLTASLTAMIGGNAAEPELSWQVAAFRALQEQPELRGAVAGVVSRVAAHFFPGRDSGDELNDDDSEGDGIAEGGLISVPQDPVQIAQLIAANLATNSPASDSVPLVRALVRFMPEHATKFAMMLYAPVDVVVAEVGKVLGLDETLLSLPHVKDWFAKLQIALRQ
jgi:hypothetical protein